MESRKYFWVFDRAVFEQITLPEFTLLEGVLIVTALAALGLYLLLIVYLDARERLRARRGKQKAWLERWLAHAQLPPDEMEALERLAGEPTPIALYELLSNAARFETRVHEELEAGRPVSERLVDKLRDMLRFHSHNLRVPIVSTRQFLPGDAVRITVWQGGLPHHFYGKVTGCALRGFSVTLRPEAAKTVMAEGAPVELVYLRGLGLEYPFPGLSARAARGPGRLRFQHALMHAQHGARQARLPVLMEVAFRRRALTDDAVSDLDPDAVAGKKERGLLLDLSTGGFALGHRHEFREGTYIEFTLPLKRGGRRLGLTGRVQECRPFSGNQWLSRCQLRGLSSLERNLLTQVLRTEQRRRSEALAPIRRRRAKAG
jgi:hypothetical protein